MYLLLFWCKKVETSYALAFENKGSYLLRRDTVWGCVQWKTACCSSWTSSSALHKSQEGERCFTISWIFSDCDEWSGQAIAVYRNEIALWLKAKDSSSVVGIAGGPITPVLIPLMPEVSLRLSPLLPASCLGVSLGASFVGRTAGIFLKMVYVSNLMVVAKSKPPCRYQKRLSERARLLACS